MSHARPRKRPCSICLKWFLPDVRQVGRQRACSPECSSELHRRNCAKWNRKNTADFKSSYLAKKLERDGRSPPNPNEPDVEAGREPAPKSRINLDLPRNMIGDRMGIGNLVITEYIVEQVFRRIRNNTSGFP